MGVSKYTARGKTWWRVDEWLTLPDGRLIRYRKKKIPTKEQAGVLAAEKKAEAFDGKFFARQKGEATKTVKELWESYEPISKRDNDSWQTNIGRARHVPETPRQPPRSPAHPQGRRRVPKRTVR